MMNCLIVDDEPLAIDVIKNHLNRIPYLNLVNTTTSAFKAIEILNSEDVDLLFLDIQMPELTGLELLNSLQKKPLVIFTTAYQEFALESYEFDAVDYLMKPIPFDKVLKAVNKAKERTVVAQTPVLESIPPTPPEDKAAYIFVKTSYKTVRLNLCDIHFIESQKDYVIFHLENSQISSQLSLSFVEDQLPEDRFLRIHRSFIVAVDKIVEVERNTLLVNGNRMTVGANYRSKFKRLIDSKKLA